MRVHNRDPRWAAEHAEREARAALERELAINRVIERRNPNLRPTARYLEPPLPPSSVQFNTRADVLRYQAKRAMGKFDPFVQFPTLSRPQPLWSWALIRVEAVPSERVRREPDAMNGRLEAWRG